MGEIVIPGTGSIEVCGAVHHVHCHRRARHQHVAAVDAAALLGGRARVGERDPTVQNEFRSTTRRKRLSAFKTIMPKRACAGEWRGAGAGGSPQHATFFANQQFRLKLRVTAYSQQ